MDSRLVRLVCCISLLSLLMMSCDSSTPARDGGTEDAAGPDPDGATEGDSGGATDPDGGATDPDGGGATEGDGGGTDGSPTDGGPPPLTSPDRVVSLSIPDGALPDGVSEDDIRVLVDESPSIFRLNASADDILAGTASLDDREPPTLAYTLEPAGTVFSTPITATFRFTGSMLPDGASFTLTSEGTLDPLTITDIRSPEPEVTEVDVEVPHFSSIAVWGRGDRQVSARLLSPAEGTTFLVGTTFEDRLEVTRAAGTESSYVVEDEFDGTTSGVQIERVVPGPWTALVFGFAYYALDPTHPEIHTTDGAGVRAASGASLVTSLGPVQCHREGRGLQYLYARPTGPTQRIWVPYVDGGLGEPESPTVHMDTIYLKLEPEVQCQADLGCGDGTAIVPEDCDGADLRDETCASMGLLGTLSCDQSCRYTGCVPGTSVGERDTVTSPEGICSAPEGFPGGSSPPTVCVAGSGGVRLQRLDGTSISERGDTYYESAALSGRTAEGEVVDQLWSVGPNGGFILYWDPFANAFGEFGLVILIGQNVTDISPVPHPTDAGQTSGALVVSNSGDSLYDVSFDGTDFVMSTDPIVTGAALTEATGAVVSAVRRSADRILIATDGSPGHLFVYDQSTSTATLVATLGEGPRRVRCARSGSPCAVTSYTTGEVAVFDWPDAASLPTARGTVSVDGPVGLDVARMGADHVVISTGFRDGTVHYTVVRSAGGALEDHSEALTGCMAPGHATWLGAEVAAGAAVTCNGSDTWQLLHPPSSSW